ncbi:hypothetical protein GCM10009722_09480 [Williamsia deligens]
MDVVQRPGGLPLPDRSAYRVDDDCVGHDVPLPELTHFWVMLSLPRQVYASLLTNAIMIQGM